MKKEYNFKNAKRVKPEKVDRDPKIMISLRVDPNVISKIRDIADSEGIPYQTLINSILFKYSEGKLFEERRTESKRYVAGG